MVFGTSDTNGIGSGPAGSSKPVFIGGPNCLRLLALGAASWRSINAEEGGGRQPALSAGLRDPASIHSTEEKQVADHSEGPGPGPGCRTLARFAASVTRHVWLASLRSDAATPMAIALDRALGT
jgi:hypothetical protein